MSVGVVFASTGGNKIVRAVRTFQAMEPGIPVHVAMAVNSVTYRSINFDHEKLLKDLDVVTRPVSSAGYVNGSFNEATEWIHSLGYDEICIFQDDLIFSPLREHRGSASQWFIQNWSRVSGVTFAHLEVLTNEDGMRRAPAQWDQEDFSDPSLWQELMQFDRHHNGAPVYPTGRDWFVRYEGSDKYRKWNRLGPTGFVFPYRLWAEFGGFDTKQGVMFDIDYPAEALQRHHPPVYAVPNVPWLHLHNQSVNPWTDPAIGIWADPLGNFAKKFGSIITDYWWGAWEERWE